MKYQIESILSVAAEALPLLQKHYDELTLNKDVVKLSPAWDRYAELEELGRFVVMTLRTEQNVLVGYSAFFLDFHLHYSDMPMASNDVLYLEPELRRSGHGLGLIQYSEDTLVALGAQKILWHVKFDKITDGKQHKLDFRPLLHRLGYSDEETCVGKIT